MLFPERLTQLRKRAGLTQRGLAALARLEGRHVWQLEQVGRKHHKTSVATLDALARVLGCSVDYLWRGTGDPPRDEELHRAVEKARLETPPALKPKRSPAPKRSEREILDALKTAGSIDAAARVLGYATPDRLYERANRSAAIRAALESRT